MSEGKFKKPFFVGQEVEVIYEITVTRNVFIEVDSRSLLTAPEHIEELLTVGTKGQVRDYNKHEVLLYFFNSTNSAIGIWVKNVHFHTRFSAGKNFFE